MAVSPVRRNPVLAVDPRASDENSTWSIPRPGRAGTGETWSLTSIAVCYGVIKEASNSPLLTDQERTLDALEALLPSIWSSSETGADGLALEMQERRDKLIQAMATGTEI